MRVDAVGRGIYYFLDHVQGQGGQRRLRISQEEVKCGYVSCIHSHRETWDSSRLGAVTPHEIRCAITGARRRDRDARR